MIIFYFIFDIIHSTVGVPGPVVDRGLPGKDE